MDRAARKLTAPFAASAGFELLAAVGWLGWLGKKPASGGAGQAVALMPPPESALP
jgi:hypothetical protein